MKATLTALRQRFIAFDERLDALAARHWTALARMGYALAFLLLFAGVAWHAVSSGVAPDLASFGGGAAILFVMVFARLTAAIQRAVFDPFQYVRPEPLPRKVARWVAWLHVLIGVALFIAVASLSAVTTDTGLKITIRGWNAAALIFGWCVGGGNVLKFFWLKARGLPAIVPPAAPN
jgi:hypothetical protein